MKNQNIKNIRFDSGLYRKHSTSSSINILSDSISRLFLTCPFSRDQMFLAHKLNYSWTLGLKILFVKGGFQLYLTWKRKRNLGRFVSHLSYLGFFKSEVRYSRVYYLRFVRPLIPVALWFPYSPFAKLVRLLSLFLLPQWRFVCPFHLVLSLIFLHI